MTTLRLLLAGDVMLGRGIDQVLPHPGDPRLFEPHVTSALDYVELAERAHGPIPRPVDFAYVWGEVEAALAGSAPDLRIVNLETAVTQAGRPAPKGINYRMTPENLPCLKALHVDCCVLANNHVLDWGEAGLLDTLAALERAGIAFAGAGRTASEAAAPAVLKPAGNGRVLVFAAALPSSGVPFDWAAGAKRAGVALMRDLSEQAVEATASRIAGVRQDGDTVVVSLHWGPNWGYGILPQERAFARALIERAGVDMIHGHSSHHPKAIEVLRSRPVLYGCGDALNDYEGISGYEDYRGDLVLLYLATFAGPGGGCIGLEMLPFRIRNFRLLRARESDVEWLRTLLDQECRRFGGRVTRTAERRLALVW